MNLIALLLISLAINGLFFLFAAIIRTDVFTDITYSLSFVVLTGLLLIFHSNYTSIQFVAAFMVLLWAARLGTYLFIRILTIKVDHRFDDKRNNPLKFGAFWLLQAITVWIVMLPVYGILTLPPISNLYFTTLFFLALSLSGLLIEAIADQQKFSFKQKPENKKRFMHSGLWAWSRHPNYFGEMLFWWGLSLAFLPFFQGYAYFYYLGPMYISLLLLFVSGIPLLEKSWQEKWGDDEVFQAYIAQTNLLIPLPPRKDKT